MNHLVGFVSVGDFLRTRSNGIHDHHSPPFEGKYFDFFHSSVAKISQVESPTRCLLDGKHQTMHGFCHGRLWLSGITRLPRGFLSRAIIVRKLLFFGNFPTMFFFQTVLCSLSTENVAVLKSMKHDFNTKTSAVHLCISGVYAKNISILFGYQNVVSTQPFIQRDSWRRSDLLSPFWWPAHETNMFFPLGFV